MPSLDIEKVKIITLPSECWICEQKTHGKFLENWNGIEICKPCKREIYEEIERTS